MKKKYEINESYFENIDSEEKAYWLGFMTADGYVGYRNRGKNFNEYSVGIDLQIKDKLHLEKLKNKITTRELTVYKDPNRCRLIIYSKKMFDDLSKYGIVPRKTFLINKIPDIEKKFKIHFIRGYFDGDGSVWEGKVKYKTRNGALKESKNIGVEFVGTLNFLKEIEKELGIKGNFNKENRRKNEIYYLKYYGIKKSNLFYNICYNNSTIYLERKKEKFIKFNQYLKNKPKNKRSSKKTFQFDLNGNLIKIWNSVVEIKQELGFDNIKISGCCNGRLKKYNGFIWKH